MNSQEKTRKLGIYESVSVMFKIITLDLSRICRMQLSCKSIKLSVICSNSSLKSNLLRT